MRYKNKLTCLGLLILLLGCKKNNVEETSSTDLLVVETSNAVQGSPQIINTGDNVVLPTQTSLNYVFDWETAQTMPGPPNKTPIPLPWANNVEMRYNGNLRYDFKKSDGWELVYNTFSLEPLRANSQKIFVLYNKFRGVLRFYTYLELDWGDPNRWTAYSNMLQVRSSNITSNLLNFADQHIVDTDLSSGNASVSGPFPLTRKGWYIAQHELAYDPNIAKQDFTSIILDWGHDFTSSFSGTLNGTDLKDGMFNIQKQNTDASLLHLNGELAVNLESAADIEDLKSLFNAESISALKRQVLEHESYSNIYSGFIVSNSNLMNIKASAKGELVRRNEAVHLSSFPLAIPGYDNSKTLGVGPVFNESLGIFYLESKPEISLKAVAGDLGHGYTLDLNSVKYLFNPFVSKYADIKNLGQEIVARDKEDGGSITESKIYHGQQLRSNKPLDIIGVRVHFDVVPKNGSSPVRIVKTFRAKVVS